MAVQGDQAATSERSPTPLLDRISSGGPQDTAASSALCTCRRDPSGAYRRRHRNGGHLGASLGAIELAVALHWVFDSPRIASSGTLDIKRTPINSSPGAATGSRPFARRKVSRVPVTRRERA